MGGQEEIGSRGAGIIAVLEMAVRQLHEELFIKHFRIEKGREEIHRLVYLVNTLKTTRLGDGLGAHGERILGLHGQGRQRQQYGQNQSHCLNLVSSSSMPR